MYGQQMRRPAIKSRITGDASPRIAALLVSALRLSYDYFR
jgi:hypothetical protein